MSPSDSARPSPPPPSGEKGADLLDALPQNPPPTPVTLSGTNDSPKCPLMSLVNKAEGSTLDDKPCFYLKSIEAPETKTPEFTLADMARHYHSQLDAILKMWNFLFLFGAGACTAAWAYGKDGTAPPMPTCVLAGLLCLTFAVYAYVNSRAIAGYQRDLLATGEIIRNYLLDNNLAVGPFAKVLHTTLHTRGETDIIRQHWIFDGLVCLILICRIIVSVTSWLLSPTVATIPYMS